MSRSIRPRLEDIDQNIRIVLDLIKHRTATHFEADLALRYAVQYAVLIIAEASNHLPEAVRADHAHIPWRRIIAIGHKLRHEYHRIDADIIWDVATEHLKPLHEVIRTLLAAHARPTLPL